MEKIYRAGGNGEEITSYKYSQIFKSDRIEFDNKIFILDPDHTAEIMPGDTYLTERDFGIQVFTCKENDKKNRQITSAGIQRVHRYPQECRRVIHVVEDIGGHYSFPRMF